MRSLEHYSREIVKEAELWWDNTGRHLVPKAINEYRPPAHVRSKGLGPVLLIKHAMTKDLNDGILLARPWAELTKGERKRVYHSYLTHTWLPAHPEFQEPQVKQ